jgi:hypothetical protein
MDSGLNLPTVGRNNIFTCLKFKRQSSRGQNGNRKGLIG